MADVFISYSRADELLANRLATWLQNAGLSVFLDTASLTPGALWTDQIHKELKNSSNILLLASRTAIASPTVNQELGIAMDRGARIIPVVWEMQPNELPVWIKRYQAVVLTGKTPQQCLNDVTCLVNRLAQEKSQRDTSQAIAILGVGLLTMFMLNGKSR